jgi:predicted phage terminase large subunit-like protein
MDWIPKCDSRWKSPYHLADFVNALERAPRGAVRCVEAVPIRHFKTITLVCAIAWWLARDPTLRVVYMTYSTHRATEIGKTIRDTCRRMDVRIASGYDTIARWSTPQGGGVAVMSADQSHLGADIDILVWDDPIESFVEVDKPEVRQRVDETIAFYTNRLNVSGSCIGIMSPMHLDDPLHRRLRRKSPPWESFIHPAIIDEDLPTERAFAPEVRSLEQIRAAKAELHESDPSDRIFLAQWMCSPITPRGDHFTNPARYRELPTFGGSRVFYGLDMSYSQATISDWSAIVVFKAWGSTAYVQHVDRFRLDVPLIGHKLLTAQSRYGTGPIFSYVSGPEIGIIQHLAERGLPVEGMPARYNKLVRATRTIRRVRESEILFPEDDAAAWVPSMIQRLTSWRGVDGDEDDEVDALVSGSEGGMFSFAGSEPTTTSGERRFQSTF